MILALTFGALHAWGL